MPSTESLSLKEGLKLILELLKRRRWLYSLGLVIIILLDLVDMIPALMVKEVTKSLSVELVWSELFLKIAILMGSYFMVGILRMGWRLFVMLPARSIERELRQEVYEKIHQGQFQHVQKIKTGDVISLISQDLINVRMLIGPGFLIFFDTLAYLIFIPFVLIYQFGLSALIFLWPLLFIVVGTLLWQKSMQDYHQQISDRLGELSQFVFEESQGQKFFRNQGLFFARENRYFEKIHSLKKQQTGLMHQELKVDGLIQICLYFSYTLMLGTLLWSLQNTIISPWEAVGQLTLGLMLLDKLVWPLHSVGYMLHLYQSAVAGLSRLKEFQKLPVKSSLIPHSPSQDVASLLPTDLKPQGPLYTMKNFNLSMTAHRYQLKNLSLVFEKGQRIALVGKVGAGKSLFLQALARLWDRSQVSFEEFLFQGHPYYALKENEIHPHLSYIPQPPEILSRTLATNVSPGTAFKYEDIYQALKRADLVEDLESWSGGVNTLIGEKGVNLSGGQKQRTLIARSLLQPQKIYLWDDCTSALDEKTEALILQEIFRLSPESLLILSTHRLSSLERFTHVLWIDEGEIIFYDTPENFFQKFHEHDLWKDVLKKYYATWRSDKNLSIESTASDLLTSRSAP
jgi:ATP-binding cassette subfamily B multidrug efflux pump